MNNPHTPKQDDVKAEKWAFDGHPTMEKWMLRFANNGCGLNMLDWNAFCRDLHDAMTTYTPDQGPSSLGTVDLEQLKRYGAQTYPCVIQGGTVFRAYDLGWNACLDHLASRGYLRQGVSEPVENKTHKWDRDGERCVYCGDKDWMDDPVCRGTK